MDVTKANYLRKECRFEESESAARRLLEEALNDVERAEILCVLGSALSAQDRLDETLECAESALTLAEQTGQERIRGYALRLKGIIFWVRGEHLEALHMCRAAHKIGMDHRDEELIYLAGISTGSILVNAGQHAEAINILEPCLLQAQKLGDWQQAGIAHGNIGVAYCARGDTPRGIFHHQEAQKIYQQHSNPVLMAMCLINLGLACSEEEDYENSLEFFTGALEFLPPGRKPLAEAEIRSGTGQALYWLFRFPEAIPELNKGVELFLNAGHSTGAAEALCYLGSTLVYTGQIEEGLKTCNKALELLSTVGRKDIHAEVNWITGCAFEEAGNHQKAFSHMGKAREFAEETGNHRMLRRVQEAMRTLSTKN